MCLPIFTVATMTDHVSPWRSVHKIHLVSNCDITFVLTSGGHNAGIISEPGRHGRHYYAGQRRKGDSYTDPERWLESATEHEGSWWPEWIAWLERVNSTKREPARPVTQSLGPAPGQYVLER